MIKPVTSTRVATKGADAVAGSSPIFRNKKGMSDPERVPHRTINTREIETLLAIDNQY